MAILILHFILHNILTLYYYYKVTVFNHPWITVIDSGPPKSM